jgi:diguanylate cyclase (GGDEF)-like protein
MEAQSLVPQDTPSNPKQIDFLKTLSEGYTDLSKRTANPRDQEMYQKMSDYMTNLIDTPNAPTGRQVENMQKAFNRHNDRVAGVEAFAEIDPLTGLLNKRHYYRFKDETPSLSYEQAIGKKGVPMAVIDIDNFKKINDTYGHGVGDEMLRRLGEIARKHAPLTHRYGGEEFSTVMDRPWTELQAPIEQLKREFQDVVIQTDKGPVSATLSIGVGENFRVADKMLYEAKAAGRNRTLVSEDIQLDKVNYNVYDDIQKGGNPYAIAQIQRTLPRGTNVSGIQRTSPARPEPGVALDVTTTEAGINPRTSKSSS